MNAQDRKERPLYSGVLKYFPDALLEVAHCSYVGNEQHNPGQPLHWAKEKSTDEPDALARHLLDAGTRDKDGARHSAKVAWRALAMLQREIEAERKTAEDLDAAVDSIFDSPTPTVKSHPLLFPIGTKVRVYGLEPQIVLGAGRTNDYIRVGDWPDGACPIDAKRENTTLWSDQ
jgi:hypothetical protein